LGEEIPEAYVSYFSKFIDSLISEFPGRLYRYITPSESAFWVAYDGFHLGRTYTKKISMTLSPVLCTESVPGLRGVWLELTGDFHGWAKAVPYTRDNDPNTGDMLVPYEFELAVYAKDYERKVREERPLLGSAGVEKYLVIPIKDLSMARLLPEALEGGVNEKDYFKLKILPEYVHGVAYSRNPYKMLPRRLLVQQLAIVTVAMYDAKIRYATAYIWDLYWSEKKMLSGKPDFEGARTWYEEHNFLKRYYASNIENVCTYSYIPSDVCRELMDDIVDEITGIYSMFDVEVKFIDVGVTVEPRKESQIISQKALALYSAFPELFKTPYESEHFLKWWHGTYEEAVMYLEEFLWNERRYRRVWLRYDPEVVEG
jgi:hypothetical protein